MPQSNQKDYAAGRIQPAQFDTILPPDARSELVRPRRREDTDRRPPSPPKRPPQVDSARSWGHPALGWLLALAGVAASCAVIGLSWPSPEKRERALQESADRSRETEAAAARALEALRKQSVPVAQPTPAPIVQPKPAQPVIQPSLPPAVVAPRARLVRLPAPRVNLRVNLIELTPEHIDESHRITMPYGTEVLATLRGFLENENQLPRIGRIGDMYLVRTIPWIWIRVPGTSAPTWVDP